MDGPLTSRGKAAFSRTFGGGLAAFIFWPGWRLAAIFLAAKPNYFSDQWLAANSAARGSSWNSVYSKLLGFNKWESVKGLICSRGRLDFHHILKKPWMMFYLRFWHLTFFRISYGKWALVNIFCLHVEWQMYILKDTHKHFRLVCAWVYVYLTICYCMPSGVKCSLRSGMQKHLAPLCMGI